MDNGVINIIKASAGSGKTYNLARIYVANLLGTPTGKKVKIKNQECDKFELRKGDFNYHRHLLAITFTNKATNEMKERIIKELHLLSKGEGDFLDDFKIMFEYNHINEVIDAAKEALNSILFDYGNFNVSTIDSFFQSILRNFARELDRDYNYDLQIDSDYATSVAVHDFLLELGKNNKKQAAINDWVKKFIENNITNKKGWDFFGKTDDLKDFASIMYKEFFHKRHADVIDYLSDIGNGVQASRIATFKSKIIAAYNYHNDGFSKSIIELREFFDKHNIPGKDIGTRLVVYQIYKGLINDLGSGEGTFRTYASMDDALSKKVLNKPSKDTVSDADNKDFKDLVNKILRHLDQSRFFGNVLNNIWNLGLLGKINEKLEEYRKDTNTILIADTNTLIGEALKSGAYFIYEHVGNRYKTYMIDEFQDTSEKQYRNFVPLIEESLGQNYSNLVIGDEKQSIYRFRNSDPSLLRDVIEEDFKGRTKPSSLDTNYRSFTSIVQFNNGLFEKIIAEYNQSPNRDKYLSLIKTYANITQLTNKKEKGYVTVNFVANAGSAKQKIFNALPSYIDSILARGYKMSDIAILVNMKSEGREIIDNIMRYNESLTGANANRHINVISTESLLLANSPSVKLILSVLRFLEITQYRLPEDNDDSLDKDFNKFLERRVSEQRFFKILHDFEACVQNADSSTDAGELLHKLIEQDYSDSSKLTPKELFDKYFDLSQELMPDKHAQLSNLVNIVDKIISKYIFINQNQSNKNLENSYLLAFVDVVHGFASKHNGGTIREFLQFWDDNPESFTIGSSSSLNAVNVMTIHKSKGLQNKCIIVPFAHWKIDKMENTFWIEDKHWDKNSSSLDINITDKTLVPPLIPVSTSMLKDTKLFSDLVDAERERCMIDNINKLYVALTRPEEELHVFALAPKSFDMECKKSIDDIKFSSDLLLRFLPTIEIDEKPMEKKEFSLAMGYNPADDSCDDDGEDRSVEMLDVKSYSFGTPISKTASDEDDEDKAPVVCDYWVSPQVLPVHVTVKNPNSSTTDEGLRMHAIFSNIKSERDFENAMKIARKQKLLEDNSYWTEEQVNALFTTIKENNLLREWFSEDNICYNELKISYPSKETFEHRRPDRIVIRPNGDVLVIDYKFGSNLSPEVLARYKGQVEFYVNLMKRLGHHNVVGYIWYPRKGKIERVGV